jgi:hypothetical protein
MVLSRAHGPERMRGVAVCGVAGNLLWRAHEFNPFYGDSASVAVGASPPALKARAAHDRDAERGKRRGAKPLVRVLW